MIPEDLLNPNTPSGQYQHRGANLSQVMAAALWRQREQRRLLGLEEPMEDDDCIPEPPSWRMYRGLPRRASPLTPSLDLLDNLPLLARSIGAVAIFDTSPAGIAGAGWRRAARAPAGFTNPEWPGTMLLPHADGTAVSMMARVKKPSQLGKVLGPAHDVLGPGVTPRSVVMGPQAFAFPIAIAGHASSQPTRCARVPDATVVTNSALGVPYQIELSYTKVEDREPYCWVRALVGDGFFTSGRAQRKLLYLYDLHWLSLLEGKDSHRFYCLVANHLATVASEVMQLFDVQPDRVPRNNYFQLGRLHGHRRHGVVPELDVRDGLGAFLALPDGSYRSLRRSQNGYQRGHVGVTGP
jgi:hypothetical protein